MKKIRKYIQHFWEYYKWPAAAVIILIAILIFTINPGQNEKEVLLSGVMLNSNVILSGEESLQEFSENFLDSQNLDLERYTLDLNGRLSYFSKYETSAEDTFYSVQALNALISSGSLDFVVGNSEAMLALAYADFFEDLSLVMDEDMLAQYEPYLLYMDLAVMEEMQKADWTGENQVTITFPDCRKPEVMNNPIPVLIDVSETPRLSSIYLSSEEQLVFAVAGNASKHELTQQMIKYLLEAQ